MIADDKGNMKQSSKTYTRGKKSTRCEWETEVKNRQGSRMYNYASCSYTQIDSGTISWASAHWTEIYLGGKFSSSFLL